MAVDPGTNATQIDGAKVLAIKGFDRRNRDALILWRLDSLSLCQTAEDHLRRSSNQG